MIMTNLPLAHGHVACLFLIFYIHFIALTIILRSLSLCIFTKISGSTIYFKTENGSCLITEYYAFTIRVDQVNFLREKFGVSACRQISMVKINEYFFYTSRYLSEYYILGITNLANLGSRRVISSGSH